MPCTSAVRRDRVDVQHAVEPGRVEAGTGGGLARAEQVGGALGQPHRAAGAARRRTTPPAGRPRRRGRGPGPRRARAPCAHSAARCRHRHGGSGGSGGRDLPGGVLAPGCRHLARPRQRRQRRPREQGGQLVGRHRPAPQVALAQVAAASRSHACWSASSTPSATVDSPSRWLIAMIACVIEASSCPLATWSTKVLSTFSTSTGQLGQVGERAVAGAEVVDRDADAVLAQCGEPRRGGTPGRTSRRSR